MILSDKRDVLIEANTGLMCALLKCEDGCFLLTVLVCTQWVVYSLKVYNKQTERANRSRLTASHFGYIAFLQVVYNDRRV
jgi:hypothetical protein